MNLSFNQVIRIINARQFQYTTYLTIVRYDMSTLLAFRFVSANLASLSQSRPNRNRLASKVCISKQQVTYQSVAN